MIIKARVAAFAIIVLFVGAASAMDAPTAIKQCNSGIPAQIMSGCTAIINANNDTPQHLALAYSARGLVYSNKGQHALAISDYSAAIRLNPGSATTRYNRAISYALSNKFESAIADFTEAIRLMPNYAKAYLDRGRVYTAMGKANLAAADAQQAARLAH
jgi:tetratricopeptide (TPR) repeat protein